MRQVIEKLSRVEQLRTLQQFQDFLSKPQVLTSEEGPEGGRQLLKDDLEAKAPQLFLSVRLPPNNPMQPVQGKASLKKLTGCLFGKAVRRDHHFQRSTLRAMYNLRYFGSQFWEL